MFFHQKKAGYFPVRPTKLFRHVLDHNEHEVLILESCLNQNKTRFHSQEGRALNDYKTRNIWEKSEKYLSLSSQLEFKFSKREAEQVESGAERLSPDQLASIYQAPYLHVLAFIMVFYKIQCENPNSRITNHLSFVKNTDFLFIWPFLTCILWNENVPKLLKR